MKIESIYKPLLMTLDIQFFSEDFDIEKADEEIMNELQENEQLELDIDEDLEVDSEEVEEEEEEEEELEVEEPETPDISTNDGRDAAFANLRRERDQFASDAEFIRNFAKANGMTVEELRQQHEQATLEREAEEKGVSVEVLQRLSAMERENSQIKEQAQSERFEAQVNSTLAKYKGTKENFDATVKYAAENGMVDALRDGTISFEAAYKLAHMDTMIEDARKNAVQDDLSMRKKRQQEAQVSAGSQSQDAVASDELDELAAADAKKILETMDF